MASTQDLMLGAHLAGLAAQQLGFAQKAITAAGTTSADATACDAQNNMFVLTATGSDGIRMSSSAPLLTEIYVANTSGSNGKVYPHTGGTVNGGSTDAGETIATTTVQIWIRLSSTAWAAVLGA